MVLYMRECSEGFRFPAKVSIEGKHLEMIKRFLWDESATAELTSGVIMIATLGVLGSALIYAWYQSLGNATNTMGGNIQGYAPNAFSNPPN